MAAVRAHIAEQLTRPGEELLSTGEAAQLLGTSRQHVVNLCDAGKLPSTWAGKHRRVRRGDVELVASGGRRLSRDQLRSLLLGHAIAGRVAADPEAARELAEPEREKGASKRLGRSTRVRLQAVLPAQEAALRQEPTTERVPVLDRGEEGEVARASDHTRETTEGSEQTQLVRRLETSPVKAIESAPRALLCGSGVIEAGQENATVQNTRISAQSVVTVMLASNPGPVVVHYISLQPRAGFTLHMSAPVSSATPFTYAVWLF